METLFDEIVSKQDIEKMMSMSYEETVKDRKMRNDITMRWRKLGLLVGIAPNSKVEKNIVEGFERTTIELLKPENAKYNEYSGGHLPIYIYPITRVIYSGERTTNKRLHNVHMPEEIFHIIETTTTDDMFALFEEKLPKREVNNIQILKNLLRYKKINNIPISQIDLNKKIMTEEEENLIHNVMFPSAERKNFDLEAEITSMLCTYIVLKFK